MTAIVTDYASTKGHKNLFHGGVPGKDWWTGFLQRWPKLVERKPQHLSKQRGSSANPATVEEYFKNVERLMDDLGIKHCEDMDRRVWNCDETDTATALASKVILARRGSKCEHEIGSGKELITLMGSGSAAGELATTTHDCRSHFAIRVQVRGSASPWWLAFSKNSLHLFTWVRNVKVVFEITHSYLT